MSRRQKDVRSATTNSSQNDFVDSGKDHCDCQVHLLRVVEGDENRIVFLSWQRSSSVHHRYHPFSGQFVSGA